VVVRFLLNVFVEPVVEVPNMVTGQISLLTLGNIAAHPDFKAYSRRQLEYAIQEARIEPAGRAGIIRVFSEEQLPLILSAVRRTARVEFR